MKEIITFHLHFEVLTAILHLKDKQITTLRITQCNKSNLYNRMKSSKRSVKGNENKEKEKTRDFSNTKFG